MSPSVNIRKRHLLNYMDSKTNVDLKSSPFKRKCNPISSSPSSPTKKCTIFFNYGQFTENRTAARLERIKNLIAESIVAMRTKHKEGGMLSPGSSAMNTDVIKPRSILNESSDESSTENNVDEANQGSLMEELRHNRSSEIFDIILKKLESNMENLKMQTKLLERKSKRNSSRNAQKPEGSKSLYTDLPSTSSGRAKNSKKESTSVTCYPLTYGDDLNVVIIGPNGTMISSLAYLSLDWKLSVGGVTRKLITKIFDRKTLSTHSLCVGINIPEKKILDLNKVNDIVHIVTSKMKNATKKEIYSAIKSKCSEQRSLRMRKSNNANDTSSE